MPAKKTVLWLERKGFWRVRITNRVGFITPTASAGEWISYNEIVWC